MKKHILGTVLTGVLLSLNLHADPIKKDLSHLKPWEVRFDSAFVHIDEQRPIGSSPQLNPELTIKNTVLSTDSKVALGQLVKGFNSFENIEVNSDKRSLKSFTAVIKIGFDQQIRVSYRLSATQLVLSEVRLNSYESKYLKIDFTKVEPVYIGQKNLMAFNLWNEKIMMSIPSKIDAQLSQKLALFIKYSTVFSDTEFLNLADNDHYKTIVFKGQIRLAADRTLDTFGNTAAGKSLTSLIMLVFGNF